MAVKRLILMGGRPWFGQDGGQKFTEALLRYYPSEVKLAFCIFAQPKTDWPETSRANAKMFTKFARGRKIEHRTITADNFAEVSAWADIIYVPGGEPFRLLERLKPFDLAQQLWDGKVIAGSSAGADLFCEGFTYLHDKTFGHGLGWVVASCVPHWRSSDFNGYTPEDWDWAEQESLSQLPNLPVLRIPESEFVELTVR